MHFPQASPLRWAWRNAVYTDGSCVPDPIGGPNALGAAFYDGPSGTTYLVDPAGQGGTNTITRAELGAIDQALAHAGLRPGPLTIFSDSLASLHLIRTATTSPASLWECKHRDLLHSITDRLVSRCSLGLATSLCKVKAHSGVRGNELADQGATAALTPTATHNFTVAAANNSVLTLPAWPHAVVDDATGTAPTYRALSNLTQAVKTALRPSLAWGSSKECNSTITRAAIQAKALP